MNRGSIGFCRGSCLFSRAEKTVGFFERMRGLLGRDQLEDDQAIWLDCCDSVHSVGMKFPIDVAFIDGGGEIRKTVSGLRPWRVSQCWGAVATLEMAVGSIERLGLTPGAHLEWRSLERQPTKQQRIDGSFS